MAPFFTRFASLILAFIYLAPYFFGVVKEQPSVYSSKYQQRLESVAPSMILTQTLDYPNWAEQEGSSVISYSFDDRITVSLIPPGIDIKERSTSEIRDKQEDPQKKKKRNSKRKYQKHPPKPLLAIKILQGPGSTSPMTDIGSWPSWKPDPTSPPPRMIA